MRKKIVFKYVQGPIRLLLYGLLASTLVIGVVLFYTPTGLQLSLKLIEKYSGGKFQFEKASGRFGQTIQLGKVLYNQPHQVIRLENVVLHWHPIAFLKWQLQIDQLNVDKITVIQKTVDTIKTPQKFLKRSINISRRKLPQLPIYLVIKKLYVGEVRVRSGGRTTFQSKRLKGKIALTRTQLAAHLQTRFILPIPTQGRLTLLGHQNQYEFQLNFFGQSFNWNLVGQGDQTQLTFNTLQDDLLQGKLNLNGWVKAPLPRVKAKPGSLLSPKPLNDQDASFKTEEGLRWQFSLEASHLRLNTLFPVVLNGTLMGEGADTQGRLVMNLTDSQYAGKPVEGQGMLRFDYPLIKSFNIEFFSGKDRVFMQGNIGETWAVQWKANLDQLNPWLPGWRGALSSQGNISGPRDAPRVMGDLVMHELKVGTVTVKELHAEAAFNMVSLTDSRVRLDAQKIKNNHFEVSQLTFLGNLQAASNGVWMHLNLQPGTFHYVFDNKRQTESFGGGSWDTRFTSDTLLTQIDLSLMGKSRFQGQLILPAHIKRGYNQKIQGRMKGQINDLSFLSVFTSPSIRNIQGQLTTDLQIKGTIGKPVLKSQMLLKASAFLPVPNLYLKDIQLNAQGEKQVIRYEGQARSENTVLKLTGKTIFRSEMILSEFYLTSPDFLMTNTREIKIHAAPTIKITSQNGKTQITGTVQISKTEIKPLDFSSIVMLPDDAHYVGGSQEETLSTNLQFPVETNLLLTMGDRVYLKYQGWMGYLTGSVRVQSQPLQPTTGFGRIEIKDGIFQIKGRQLTIHQGYFNFNGGPLANPSLQIRASRKIQVNNIGGLDPNLEFGVRDMLVGVQVSGNIQRYKVKLFSEPSGLSQANILSYLITGQSSQTGGYSTLIAEAGKALGGGMHSPFANEIKKESGLPDVSIQQTKMHSEAQEARSTLVFGKLLSPVFYVNYTVNLLRPLSGFQARYQLSKYLILQVAGVPGEKGASIDLIRSFESKD